MRARPYAVTSLLSLVLFASAVVPASAAPGITVEIGERAWRGEGGQSILLTAAVTCSDLPGPVLEAFVQVTQEHQSIFGEGSFPALTCDGTRRVYHMRAFSTDAPFKRGFARASAFILACDESGASCEQGQGVQHMLVR